MYRCISIQSVILTLYYYRRPSKQRQLGSALMGSFSFLIWSVFSANKFISPPVPILGTRYRTVLFPKLADAFLMMYQTATAQIFTNIGAFGGFCHGNPVSIERVHSGDFSIEKARKRRIVGVYRLLDRWQGQKDLNPRHAVLEAMLKFISRSGFSPILEICCQPRL